MRRVTVDFISVIYMFQLFQFLTKEKKCQFAAADGTSTRVDFVFMRAREPQSVIFSLSNRKYTARCQQLRFKRDRRVFCSLTRWTI